MKRGLVIGKFYPPHAGHEFLINSAARYVDELHVIVCQRRGETPDGQLRASWLRELHPRALVIVVEDKEFDADDSALWAAISREALGFTPDIVFTSEEYGDEFAQCLGCEHLLIDQPRRTVPISGSQVRSDPLGSWDYLAPCVRAYYAKRVCIVGAESTGKTTLAAALAEHYKTAWVSEYGREVSERQLSQGGQYDWRSSDFVDIAVRQCQMEDQAARAANKLLICDTDALATSIWHLRYIGRRSDAVDAVAASHRPSDLYLLSDSETVFVQDGTRDGESIRRWMHDQFVAELNRRGCVFAVLSGSYDQRKRQAIGLIDELMRAQLDIRHHA